MSDKPGGLHIDRVPCDNCGGSNTVIVHEDDTDTVWDKCPSCVDGMTWPEWAMELIENIIHHLSNGHTVVDGGTLFDALVEAQEGDKP